MRPLYLTQFGLSEPPFSKEVPDADLWTPPSKEALVDDLVAAASARQSILLVGGARHLSRGLAKRL